ncbi:MAG: YifB family Mg chelatase-like AAA ATPase [Synechococcaceae cyanobacterium]|nr:YifB family Mg chelatase-like AAA ATPase [Synechococcaceae cyanobacterium]
MLARCSSAALWGLEALEVNVEVDIAPGLPGLQLVGLPDAAVQEARERVRSALRNSGLKVPLTRVVVSLAPADLRKAGPGFDLPIALGLLTASGQLPAERLAGVWSAAELGLDGRLRPVRGVLALALAAQQAGARALLVPSDNAAEAALVEGLEVWGAADLAEAIQLLQDPEQARRAGGRLRPPAAVAGAAPERAAAPDLAEVRGQQHGRRALEIAAAGGHHLLLVGPPGSGKTMLARRLPSLLPPLSRREALELTRLQSVAGLLPSGSGLVQQRPFRSPHHSCSAAALIGGGPLPRPGELSLAHHGVLFLDELVEFRREVLEQLRQPLEEREIWISRARQRCRFPCRVTLVASCNPCPCGWTGDPQRACVCGEGRRSRYWARLSGPLLDRIDLQVVMRRAQAHELAGLYRDLPHVTPCRSGSDSAEDQGRGMAGPRSSGESAAAGRSECSASVASRVEQARDRMRQRNPDGCVNADLSAGRLAAVLDLEEPALALWERALGGRRLTARGGERLLRVARTISDLAGRPRVDAVAVAEALSFRSFDLVADPLALDKDLGPDRSDGAGAAPGAAATGEGPGRCRAG